MGTRSWRVRLFIVALPIVLSLGLGTACSGNQAGRSDGTALPPASATGTSNRDGTSPPTAVPQTRTPVEVPSKYKELYEHLSANLDAYQSAIDAMPASPRGPGAVVAGAELLPANGNRLEQLLAPTTLPAVDAWLERFRAQGITGVTLGIKLPMLLPSFGPNSEAYATFFATVADHARSRGMTVDVELGALFCGTVYANCKNPFDGTYRNFVDTTVDQARLVISRVHPDYLTILSEPTTEGTLAGVKELGSPAGSARYVHDVLAGIGDRGATKIGAGAASWMPAAYNEAILRESIDYLVLHIYPVNAQIAATIVADTALARNAGKPIVADEIGLYKTDSPSPAGAATAEGVYRLDSFSFFEPLDVRFATITANWAKKAGVAYASFYWAGQLYSYVPWSAELDSLPYPALTQRVNEVIAQAFRDDKMSALGRTWPAVTK